MADFNLKRREVKAPSFGGGGNSGMSALLGYMIAQQKGQGLKEQLGSSARAVSGTDPSTGARFETPESRKYTADAQNQLNRITQLKGVVKELENLAMSLPTDPIRAGLQFAGAKFAGGRMGTEGTKTYMDAVPSAGAGVYRAVTGDNRLSDQDAAQRAYKLFWNPPLEGSETREGKFAFLNHMINESEKNITPGEPQDDMESLVRWQSFVNRAKKQFGEQGSGGSDINTEKDLALKAIQAGKNPAKVRDIFKQRTGQELDL